MRAHEGHRYGHLTRFSACLALVVLTCAGCAGAEPPPPPTVTVTATETAPPTPATPAPSMLAFCDYQAGELALVISGWDLVKASRGASDHTRMLEGMISSVESAQDSEERGCSGAVESAHLMMELAVLNAQVAVKGEGDTDRYKTVMDLGNAWFDAVGYTEHRFTMGARDLG